MWINRKEWEEKCDENRKLIANKAEKELYIDELRDRNIELCLENEALKKEVESKNASLDFHKQRISTLDKDYNIIMTANQKLTDWINKIINEVGIYEVKDKRTITIPVYKNDRKIAAYKGFDELNSKLEDFLEQEEVIIPEIRFVRMK